MVSDGTNCISFHVKSIQLYLFIYLQCVICLYSFFPDRDEGWVELIENIEETLKKDLKIISEFSPTNYKIIAKQIGAFHALDGYETLIMTYLDEKMNQYAFMRNAIKIM